MTPNTITPAVKAVCHCKANTGLRHSPRSLHTRTRLSPQLRMNLDSSLNMTWFHSAAVQFLSLSSSCVAPLPTEASMGKRQGHHEPGCLSARRLRMVQEDTGVPNEAATCAWIAADEAVDCTRAFFRSSRRLICRGRLESGFCVNGISRIHWSQHLLTTQSGRPNR
ncbi:uncharacterized protein TNCV_4503661 [Trichonephila clavipes]|nr:uncharacterized protein TNCV_4503661 [Trichonephila clavipes]